MEIAMSAKATNSLKLLPSGLPTEQQVNIVMALREIIMEYYQGTCVKRLAHDRDISVTNLADYIEHTAHWRQREWEMRQTNPRIVLLKDQPLFTLEHKKIILYVTKDNSNIVQREVERFMARYLSHINIETKVKPPKKAPESRDISYEQYLTALNETIMQYNIESFGGLTYYSVDAPDITEMPF